MAATLQKKRLIVCCDGTWQSQDNDCPTNVLKIAQAVKPIAKDEMGKNISQVLYYDEGIGTVSSEERKKLRLQKIMDSISLLPKTIKDSIEKVCGGSFGWWIDDKIKEAYLFLSLNYLPGDEIYLFGFSRGAYTVRSLAGLINCSGLLKHSDIHHMFQAYEIYRLEDTEEQKQKAKKFRQDNAAQQVEIKFLGCWDTVGALGIPNLISWLPIDYYVNKKYQFHNTELSPIIQNARHAIAIDEKRKAFDVNIMKPGEGFKGTLKQVWFPGDHGCVGGGIKETLGLSNAALKWMAEEAGQLGLDLDLSLAENTEIINSKAYFSNGSRLGVVGECYRNIAKLDQELENEFKFDLDKNFHPSVKERWCAPDMKYRPKNLKEFLSVKISESENRYHQSENRYHHFVSDWSIV